MQYDFGKARKVAGVEVYWFDDTGGGSCRVPKSWKILYRKGESWQEVEEASAYGAKVDAFNRVTFKPVEADALKIEATLQADFSAGILEWKVKN